MPQPNYLFKKYPAYRYKAGHKPMIVHNKKEDSVALADDWTKTPTSQVIAEMGDISEQEKELVAKTSEGVSAAVNMMLRVDKSRSKKALIELGELLDIDLNNKMSLKEMKVILHEEAKKAPELDQLIEKYGE